jgi:peptidoglycan glycosyltransferase
MARRIRWLGVGMTLCFVLLFLQLNNIQVVKAHQYANDPNNPTKIAARFNQPHGIIESADGQTLAKSVPSPAGSLYKYKRVYPEQWAQLFSGVVGTDSINFSNYGVEQTYNNFLVAHSRPVKTLKDLLTTSPPITDTITLTVSTKMQEAAKAALGGKVGAVVALDPQTGSVLAMYANPTFDPNPLASLDGKTEADAFKIDTTKIFGFAPLTSLAYQNAGYAPGSTFKTITTAAAYDHAPQLVNTPIPAFATIPVNYFKGQATTLSNDTPGESCGGTIAVMLPISCDTGYAILGTKIGPAGMLAEAQSFGFNQQPPIDLPHSRFEISDFLQPASQCSAQVFLAFSSIGQKCTAASPLQMAMVASAIADNGTMMTPHVMSQIRDSDGNLVEKYQTKPWKQATSAATAAAVTNLMRQVVSSPQGTAAGVGFLPQDDVAAKTGTAQAGAGNTAVNAWMIAFAPASHPVIAVAAMVPNARLDAFGATVAGPIVKAMIEAALNGR